MNAIHLAETDAQILVCFPVMQALRPSLERDGFVARVRRQQADGYRLAWLDGAGLPVAVAGFRIGENLAWGRHLYVDDLATLATHRSQGHGAALLAWLFRQAADLGCAELHLDSGLQRADAHRFYRREGMEITSHHFRAAVPTRGTVAMTASGERGVARSQSEPEAP